MKDTSEHGLSFGTVLFIVFIVLKLCGTIDWSWWRVTCPLWIPLAIVACLWIIVLAAFGVVSLFKARENKE